MLEIAVLVAAVTIAAAVRGYFVERALRGKLQERENTIDDLNAALGGAEVRDVIRDARMWGDL